MKQLHILIISLLLLCTTYGCGTKESNHIEMIGTWLLVESDGVKSMRLNDTICFYTDESFNSSLNESGNWTYKYFCPDSLIIYNRGFGEQRFTVVRLSNDTLILQLKENLIYPDFVDSLNSKNIDIYIRMD